MKATPQPFTTGPWSVMEEEFLRTHYPSKGARYVAAALNRPLFGTHKRAKKLQVQRVWGSGNSGVRKPSNYGYSETELVLIQELYPRAHKEAVLAALPGRTMWGIAQEARSRFGLTRHSREWHPDHLAALLAHYPTGGSRKVAELTGLTLKQISAKAFKLKLRFQPPQPQPKPNPAPKPPKLAKPVPIVSAAAKPKPSLPSLYAIGTATKTSPKTPNLNAQKAARITSEKQQKADKAAQKLVTADELKQLPYTDPARMAYLLNAKHGGHAASAAFRAVQATPTYKALPAS